MVELIGLAPIDAFGSHTRMSVTGLTITVRSGLGVATVTVKGDAAGQLSRRMLESYGLAPPRDARRQSHGEVAFMGIGPTSWLALAENRGSDWAAELAQSLEGSAAVANQSGAYGVLRLEGPLVRDLLARGVSLDLDPAAFPVGRAAVTNLDHFGCILWRLDGPHTFEIAVFRSVAKDVWRSLERTVAILSSDGADLTPVAAARSR